MSKNKLSTARHQIALERPELRQPTVPRRSPSGITSAPIKVNPDAGLIAAYEGKAAAAEGQAFVDEQLNRNSKAQRGAHAIDNRRSPRHP
jgi:hypothetical protein